MNDEDEKIASKQAQQCITECIRKMPDTISTPILCAAIATLVSAYEDDEETATRTLALVARAMRDFYRFKEAEAKGLN